MLRWKSSLKPAAAAPSGDNPGTTYLVAWLGMEEGSGTDVDDSTSNNNDFTLTNGSWVTGKVGNYAVRLDGTDDYIDSDANFAVGANVCTVSFWMYWTDAGSDEKFIYELGNRWWQNDGSIAFSWVQNESVFKASMHDGSGNLEVKFPEPSSSQWVYVTVVHNGPGGSGNAGEIKLYYDGTAQSSSSYSSTKNAANNIGQAGSLFFIGANSAGAQEITIDVDTFAVFSDELTQDEITWMYNSGSGRSYSDVSGGGGGSSFPSTSLVGFYKLDEASGVDAADSSGNSHTFSDNGTVASTTGTIGGETVNVRTLDRPAGKYFSLANNANFDVGDGEDFTIAFWAKMSSSMSDYSAGGIFSKRNAVSASDTGYSIALSKFPSLPTRIRYNEVSDGTSEAGDTNSNTSVAQDAWGHFMMVFTADSTLVTYVNNAQYDSVDASSVTGSLANSYDNYIGQLAYNNNGSIIADVTHLGFWKKALDSSERTALYNSGKVLAPAAPSGPAGDAVVLDAKSTNYTGGVESTIISDASSTVYGSYATGYMYFRDATRDGSWTDDGIGLLWDHSTSATDWVSLIGTTGGTFNVYEEGTSTLIYSLAWSGTGTWSGNTDRYGSSSIDFTGTVPANDTRVDVYHVKS